MSSSRWFKKYSDSDSDSESISNSSSEDSSSVDSKTSSIGGLANWLRKDNDSFHEDKNKQIFESGEVKKKKEIDKIVESLETHNIQYEYKEFYDTLVKMKEIIKRDGTINSDFIRSLIYIKENFLLKIEEIKEYIKEHVIDQKELISFDKSISLCKSLVDEHSYAIYLFNKKKEHIDIHTTEEEIFEHKLLELIKRNDHRISDLEDLLNVTDAYSRIQVRILSVLVTDLLNSKQKTLKTVKIIIDYFQILMKRIIQNNDFNVFDADSKILSNKDNIKIYIILSLAIVNLHKSYINLLQNSIPNSEEYTLIYSYESIIFKLAETVYLYYQNLKIKRKERYRNMSIVASVLIEIMYYQRLTENRRKKIKIYFDVSQRLELDSKSLLYYVYSLLLHNEYDKGKILLTESNHTLEDIDNSFICTEELSILYNHILVQLGITAYKFR